MKEGESRVQENVADINEKMEEDWLQHYSDMMMEHESDIDEEDLQEDGAQMHLGQI